MFQLTDSLPKGIYKIERYGEYQLGTMLTFTIPKRIKTLINERKWFPHSHLKFCLMKRLTGVPGDIIRIEEGHVFINDFKMAAIKPYDKQGKKLPSDTGTYALKEDEYYFLNNDKDSFDSRYFGPIKQKNIKGVIKPVIIWESENEETNI